MGGGTKIVDEPSAGLSATWREADVPEAKAVLLHAIYERIVVTGRALVPIRLTPAAYAHGLPLALPGKVAMARPTGPEPVPFGATIRCSAELLGDLANSGSLQSATHELPQLVARYPYRGAAADLERA